MASGRRNRGSRHRSHRQHHKQKVDFADSDSEPSLRHGPLPESDSCSPWRTEHLPPQVEGPSALKQDIVENPEINRESHKVSLSGSAGHNKRRREVEFGATVPSPPSLDRWNGGQSHGDVSLPMLDIARSGSQDAQLEFPTKNCTSDGEGTGRKGKCHEISNAQSTINQQIHSNVTTSLKPNINYGSNLSEFLSNEVGRSCTVDGDESAIQSVKGSNLALSAEDDFSISRKISLKRWERERGSDTEFHPLQCASSDTSMFELEHKRAKTSEALLKTKMPVGVVKGMEQQSTIASMEKRLKSAYWAVQTNFRNLELEKELEKRIRRRQEEAGGGEKGKETRRPYHKEDDHDNPEGVPVGNERCCETLQHELFFEKERNELKNTSKDTEKHKDEKVKVERGTVNHKDGEDHEKKSNQHSEVVEIELLKNSKNERHRDGNHQDADRDDKIVQTQDIKLKESNRKESRSHGKQKEGVFKEEKGEETIFRVGVPIEGQEEAKKKGFGDIFHQGRGGSDKERSKERVDKYDRFRDGKVKMDKKRDNKQRVEMGCDCAGEFKGAHGDRKGEKEFSGVYKQREELGRDHKDDKHKASRDSESRWRDNDIKTQVHKDRDGKYKNDALKSKRHEHYVDNRKWLDIVDNDDKQDWLKDGRDEKIGKPKDKVHAHAVCNERKKSSKVAEDLQKIMKDQEDWRGDEGLSYSSKAYEKTKKDARSKGQENFNTSGPAISKSVDGVESEKLVDSDDDVAAGEGAEDLSDARKKGVGRDGTAKGMVSKVSKQGHINDQGRKKDSMEDKAPSQLGAVLANEMGQLKKATITVDNVDAPSVERDHESLSRPGNKIAEGKDDGRSSYQNQEHEIYPYDLPRSPSPAHFSAYEKTTRRAEASMSSSSGTRRPRERSHHVDLAAQQQHSLDEEVRSWEPHLRNQEDKRGRSWTPDKYHDYENSPSPRGFRAKGHDEPLRGRMRDSVPYDDDPVHERDLNHPFTQGGVATKLRRLDDPSWDRGERVYQSAQSNRLAADRLLPTSRVTRPSGLLPPPPPFRPGIDHPAVLGNSVHSFEGGPSTRDGGKYDRKSGAPLQRSEMPGSEDTWKGVPVGSWHSHGPVPGGMLPPYGSGAFYGMGQQLPVASFFGRNGMWASAEMRFGGARFHRGDAFSGHVPNPGSVMGWHPPAEGEDGHFPPLGSPLDAWEGQGLYSGERQRFEWDQGFPGRVFPCPWQGQGGDDGFGFNAAPQPMLREGVKKLNAEEASHEDVETSQAIKDHMLDAISDGKVEKDTAVATVTLGESKLSSKICTRIHQALLQTIDVSVKLAGVDLYKQYLDMLPSPEAKRREALLSDTRSPLHFVDEDLEFEADPEALDLLASADGCMQLLFFPQERTVEGSLKAYDKSTQENRTQRSLFGSFLLPVGLSLTKNEGENSSYKVVDEGILRNSLSNEGLVNEGHLVHRGPKEDLVVQCTNGRCNCDPIGVLDMAEMVVSRSQQVENVHGVKYVDGHLPSSSGGDHDPSRECDGGAQPLGRADSDSNNQQSIASEDFASPHITDNDGDMKVPVIAGRIMEVPEGGSLDASVDSDVIDSDPEGNCRSKRSPEKACENTH